MLIVLVSIPGGTATRSGRGQKIANIPIRLLTRTGYTIQSPASIVLAPNQRVILAPAGQLGSKPTPQNQDKAARGFRERHAQR